MGQLYSRVLKIVWRHLLVYIIFPSFLLLLSSSIDHIKSWHAPLQGMSTQLVIDRYIDQGGHCKSLGSFYQKSKPSTWHAHFMFERLWNKEPFLLQCPTGFMSHLLRLSYRQFTSPFQPSVNTTVFHRQGSIFKTPGMKVANSPPNGKQGIFLFLLFLFDWLLAKRKAKPCCTSRPWLLCLCFHV